jgi:hypothetical protein
LVFPRHLLGDRCTVGHGPSSRYRLTDFEIRVGVQEDHVFLDAAGPDSTLEYIADNAAIDAAIVVADES